MMSFLTRLVCFQLKWNKRYKKIIFFFFAAAAKIIIKFLFF